MAVEADLIYRNRGQIVQDLIVAWQAYWPDLASTPDSVIRIICEVFAQSMEGIYLANQLLHDDMFIDTAQALSLIQYADQFGRPRKGGTFASGSVSFVGDGGTAIALGAQVSADRIGGDPLLFNVTQAGSIPNPGTPTAPTLADGGAGAMAAGTYEYQVSFLTADGETAPGAISATITIAASHQVNLTAIPLGGTGTTQRNVYRRVNGGAFGLVANIANNTATTLTDNSTSPGVLPLVTSTALSVTLPVQADESGSQYNVGPGSITTVSDAPGVAAVTNKLSFLGGDDDEEIEELRNALLQFIRNPKTGSPSDLEAWAESIEGVAQATAFSNDNQGVPAPGHATVRIVGPSGLTPSADLQNQVLAYLQSKDLANIILHVGTFQALPVTVVVDVTPTSTYSLGDITQSVQTAVANYINSLGVGETVYVSGIIAAVFGLAGVSTVTVSSPNADITSLSTDKPVAGAITVV